jgi:hypothetical protein
MTAATFDFFFTIHSLGSILGLSLFRYPIFYWLAVIKPVAGPPWLLFGLFYVHFSQNEFNQSFQQQPIVATKLMQLVYLADVLFQKKPMVFCMHIG